MRDYVAARFEQVPNPAILIMGDCNDGPGQDYFELEYLFFDLVTNLQGEVLLAERFFNHALFDFPAHLRWTAKFRTRCWASRSRATRCSSTTSSSASRSVGTCSRSRPARTRRRRARGVRAGNAGASSRRRTSDHRPVSVVLTENVADQVSGGGWPGAGSRDTVA